MKKVLIFLIGFAFANFLSAQTDCTPVWYPPCPPLDLPDIIYPDPLPPECDPEIIDGFWEIGLNGVLNQDQFLVDNGGDNDSGSEKCTTTTLTITTPVGTINYSNTDC